MYVADLFGKDSFFLNNLPVVLTNFDVYIIVVGRQKYVEGTSEKCDFLHINLLHPLLNIAGYIGGYSKVQYIIVAFASYKARGAYQKN